MQDASALVLSTVTSVASVIVSHQGEIARHEIAKAETRKELSSQGIRRQSKWIYLDKVAIDQRSMSRADGLDEAKETKWRGEFMHVIQKAGVALLIPQWGIAGAALLCHRFFSRKSMKKNCRFAVAAACLHLAAKVEESPKPIREVVKECETVRYFRNQSVLQAKLRDKAYMEEAKENVLMAERAVLYTLGFELNITHPYSFLMQQFTSLKLQSHDAYKHLMQNTWNFINDSLRTTLCLQFPPEKLGCAALFLASEINKLGKNGRGIEDVLREKCNGQPCDFFQYFDVTLDEVEAITHQMLSVYEQSKNIQGAKPPSSQGHAPGSTPSGQTHLSPMLPPPVRNSAHSPYPSQPENGSAGMKRKAEDMPDSGQARMR